MLHFLNDTGAAFPAIAEAAGRIAVTKVSRRSFLAGSGAGLALMVAAPAARAFPRYTTGGEAMPHGLVTSPLVFVRIAPDGQVTLIAHRSEMGTGSRTSLPMIMADEMEADWARVTIEQAPGDEPKYGNQDTDGSRSLRHHVQAARQIGASARAMLAAAAAEKWGVPVAEVKVANHMVTHGSNSAGFGELAEAAMALPAPEFEALTFKDEADFRYIGKGQVQITDLHDITTGKAVYGADHSVPGMKIAVVARPPAVGDTPAKWDEAAAMAVPGVRSVHQIAGSVMPAKFAPLGGIAVVADSTWAAIRGREALAVEWAPGPHAGYDSGPFMEAMVKAAEAPGAVLRTQGDPDAAFAGAAKVVARTYTQAHMAHAPMEPPVALAVPTADGGMEIWAPVQSPYACRTDAAATLGIGEDKVRVNVTLLGGGFGRKSKHDFALEAAILAKATGGPVRVQWTREDDIKHSFYHTASAERVEAALDASGKVVGWRHNSVAPSILSTFAPDGGHQFALESGMGHIDTPFDIPNQKYENGEAFAHTRIGWFRSVSNVPRAWAIGSFVGELAEETGRDQLAMWKALIGAPRLIDPVASGMGEGLWNYGEPYAEFPIDTGRLLGVLDMAAEAIGWGEDLPEGEGLGLSVHRSFVSYVACAARVKLVDGEIRVPELHLAIDAGFIANPERVESQMQGAAVMGMTLALHSGITYAGGAVEQSNFYDYEMVRSSNFPVVTVHVAPHPFSVHASGVGEPGVPPVAPAIANALRAAGGGRLRALPMGAMI